MSSVRTKQVTMERVFTASVEEVWDLWTTKEGIESWWGPDGFSVSVRQMDLRVGGKLLYGMTATEEPQIAFMKQAGMPLTTESTITFKEIVPGKRLVYAHVADFIPGMDPYDVDTRVELVQEGETVRMILTFDRMHDDLWTERAVAGWTMELNKLERVLAA